MRLKVTDKVVYRIYVFESTIDIYELWIPQKIINEFERIHEENNGRS